MKESRQVNSLRRAASILAALGRSENRLSFRALQGAAGGITDASLSRLLKALQEVAWIEPHPEGYILAPGAVTLARAILGDRSLEHRARPLLEMLSKLSHESSGLFQPHPEGITLLYKHEVVGGMRLMPEGETKTELMGHGGALLACAYDETYAREVGPELCSFLRSTAPAFERRLAKMRTAGYHLGHGEESGPDRDGAPIPTLTRLSAPLLTPAGELGAIASILLHTNSPKAAFPPARIRAFQALLTSEDALHLAQALHQSRPVWE